MSHNHHSNQGATLFHTYTVVQFLRNGGSKDGDCTGPSNDIAKQDPKTMDPNRTLPNTSHKAWIQPCTHIDWH